MIYLTIQARMGSTRLPGKVLKHLWKNYSVLTYMIKRLSFVDGDKKIVILTTKNKKDLPIVKLCKKLKIDYFRGSEHDVLKRMYDFIIKFDVHESNDVIVDLTGDCPLVDPYLINDMIFKYLFYGYQYLSNIITRSYPDGFDIQLYSSLLIKKLNNIIHNKNHRDHTGWNILNYSHLLYKYIGTIKIGNIPAPENQFYPGIGMTVDTKEDLTMLQTLLSYFDTPFPSSFELINKAIAMDLIKINKTIERKIPGVR